jgi:hypothetical protein
MNAAHTPTPRTDAFFDALYKDVPDEMTELSAGQEREFARQLERELAEVMKQRDALARIGGKLRNVCPSSCDDYVAEWDKALATLEGRGE